MVWKGEEVGKQEGGTEAADKTRKESIILKQIEENVLRENASHNSMVGSRGIKRCIKVTQDAGDGEGLINASSIS